MSAAEDRADQPYQPVEELNPPAERLEHPVLRQLFAYWEAKRGGRMAPARHEIDPVDFRYALGWVNLLEVHPGAKDFEFRVFGSLLARVLQQDTDLTSTAGTDDAEFHAVAMQDMTRVITERKPLRIFRDLQTGIRRYRFEVLLLPLSDDGETVNMLLTCAIPPLGG